MQAAHCPCPASRRGANLREAAPDSRSCRSPRCLISWNRCHPQPLPPLQDRLRNASKYIDVLGLSAAVPSPLQERLTGDELTSLWPLPMNVCSIVPDAHHQATTIARFHSPKKQSATKTARLASRLLGTSERATHLGRVANNEWLSGHNAKYGASMSLLDEHWQ